VADRILVCVAWPYANYFLHVGQVAGAYLPADIFARYQRLSGNDVLMVSGSDCHGTPITVTADQEGVGPRDIVDRYHPKILEVWDRLGITFDLFTTTLTDNHYQTTQELFTHLLEHDLLYTKTQEQLFDPEVQRFLPDRYVEGTCPRCEFANARGDQCDNCGSTLDATDLINPRSKMSGATPEIRESEHFFLRISVFEDRLREWVKGQDHWRRNVRNVTLGMLDEGLPDRAITRDISWGVPVPVEGWDSKRIYVWFDAVIGYLSATREWAQSQGQPDAWKLYWQDDSTKSYYFIGKDNIPFHTVVWPAMLLGDGTLNLPYDVPANQYVNTPSGAKQSKSGGTGNWVLDLLDVYDADVLRFYLTNILPETSDSEFREDDLIRMNNEVLIATWGNLANRVTSMLARNFEGVVPETAELAPESKALLAEADEALNSAGEEFNACRFRNALNEAMKLAQSANKYLDARAPWKAVKTDIDHAAETLSTAVNVIGTLTTMLHPVIPNSTAALHSALGNTDTLLVKGWSSREIAAGTRLAKPEALYTKLELPVEEPA
jgi:methionyl-tRNA synthetase